MKIRYFSGGGIVTTSAHVRKGVFVLHEELVVEFDDGMKVTIPAGFAFDGASIPARIRSAIQSLSIPGYVAFALHDYAYASDATWMNSAGLSFSITREEADRMALALCEWLGLDLDDRIEIYEALRLAGGRSFRHLPVNRTIDQVAEHM